MTVLQTPAFHKGSGLAAFGLSFVIKSNNEIHQQEPTEDVKDLIFHRALKLADYIRILKCWAACC